MKKAKEPLAYDLRAGGYLAYPLVQLFRLRSFVWQPSCLTLEHHLAEPFAAWAADAYFRLGCIDAVSYGAHFGAYVYKPVTSIYPHHFTPRLNTHRAQLIVERVIQ